jgi:hypothetical protein
VRKGKAPKGESHERCRYETEPVRVWRDKTVQRVIKPWRRTRDERWDARRTQSNRQILNVLKGTKVQESGPTAAADGLEDAGQNSIGKPKLDESLLPVA